MIGKPNGAGRTEVTGGLDPEIGERDIVSTGNAAPILSPANAIEGKAMFQELGIPVERGHRHKDFFTAGCCGVGISISQTMSHAGKKENPDFFDI